MRASTNLLQLHSVRPCSNEKSPGHLRSLRLYQARQALQRNIAGVLPASNMAMQRYRSSVRCTPRPARALCAERYHTLSRSDPVATLMFKARPLNVNSICRVFQATSSEADGGGTAAAAATQQLERAFEERKAAQEGVKEMAERYSALQEKFRQED